MIKFRVEGIQYKSDEHSNAMSLDYKNFNPYVIGISDARDISCIKVSTSDINSIIEVWHGICNLAKYMDCKIVCWHHDCQFLAYPDSDPTLLDGDWAYYVIDYRLLHFGPYEPKKNKTYEEFNDNYRHANEALNNLYRQIEEAKKKKANIIYNRFASNVKDEIKPKEFSPGTPKIVKKYVNDILKMTIGILSKSNEKYLIDFKYELGNNSNISYGPNGRKFRVQDTLFVEWLDSLSDMHGNYGQNYEIAASYVDRYLKKKLKLSEEEYEKTYYSYIIHLIKGIE